MPQQEGLKPKEAFQNLVEEFCPPKRARRVKTDSVVVPAVYGQKNKFSS